MCKQGGMSRSHITSSKSVFFLLFQEQKGTFSPNPARATSRLSQGSVISYASHFSRSTTRRNSDTSSVDGKTIKDFFKNMMRKFCPDRPRYFNRPLEDKHGCDDKVSSVPEHCLHLVIFYQRQWVMKLQLKIIISQVILTTFIPIAFFSQISIPLQHLLVHQSLTHSDHATNFTVNSFLNDSINSTWLQVHFSEKRPVILYTQIMNTGLTVCISNLTSEPSHVLIQQLTTVIYTPTN